MSQLLHHLTYYASPASKWLVFIHGAGGNIATWSKQVDAFKGSFNLLFFDLRDHGQSKRIDPNPAVYTFSIISQDLKHLLDHLNIRSAHFITLSFGSVLIQDFASRYPSYVDRIVVAGGVFSGSFLIKSFVALARFFNQFLNYQSMYTVFSYLLMPYPRNQKARKVYQKHATQLSQEEYMKWVALYHEFFSLLQQFLKKTIRRPILIVMGGDDYIFLDGARKFAANNKHVKLEVLDKVGHICNIESPIQFNQLALNFLREGNSEEKPTSIISSDTNLL